MEISRRDYFAAKAMDAYIGYLTARGSALSQCHSEVAEEACRIADALLAELDKPTDSTELTRLQSLNAELLGALQKIADKTMDELALELAEAAIAKATEPTP